MWGLLVLLAGAAASPSPQATPEATAATRPPPRSSSSSPSPGTTPGQRDTPGRSRPSFPPPPPPGILWVKQEPPQLWKSPGTTAILNCRVVTTRPRQPLHLEWLRDRDRAALCGATLDPDVATTVACSPHAQLVWHWPQATLRLYAVQPADSDRYVCRVAGAGLPAAAGKGSWLRVGAAVNRRDQVNRKAPHPNTGLPKALAGAVSAVVLLLGSLLGWYRWRSSRSTGTAVYGNTVPCAEQRPTELPLFAAPNNSHQLRPPGPPAPPGPPGAWP